MPIDWMSDTTAEIQSEKSAGPSTDPSGTPYLRFIDFEQFLEMRTHLDRSLRYEFIQFKAPTAIPNTEFSPSNKMLWDTVSNAAEGSRRTRKMQWHLSISLRI